MGQSSPRLAGAMGGADLRSKLGGTIGFEASRAGPHNGRTLTDCPTNYARPARAVRITRQRDAARLQVGDDRQQVRQRAPEPVELPHDQRVARVQIVEAGFQARSIVARAGCLVGMEIPMIDAGCD